MKLPLILTLFLLSGCFSLQLEKNRGHALQHVVLCWLKESGNSQHREEIIAVSKTFRNIPGVLDVRAGQVVPSDRAIVDDSFDLGIIITLADSQRLKGYLVHPIHQKAVEEVILPLVRRTVVYDFVE